VVAGTEEGLVSAWDLRSSAGPTWSASVASDYVGSLALTPCGRFVVAGAADGYVSVLDVRRGGTRLASVPVEAPVRWVWVWDCCSQISCQQQTLH
jgi:WD40 repeat protein